MVWQIVIKHPYKLDETGKEKLFSNHLHGYGRTEMYLEKGNCT